MNPNFSDGSLPFMPVDSGGGTCPGDGGRGPCGPGGCLPGSAGNLPMPGPTAEYCFGSFNPSTAPCAALPSCFN